MKISNSFIPTLYEVADDEKIISHQLMIRSGMIRQVAKGIFCWLPLGLKVLEKINAIIREEQNKIGAHEIQLPVLQPSSLWKQSDRYDAYGKEMLRIYDRENNELIYAPTNEEIVCEIFKKNVKSYQELPKLIYCIGSKFRDEIRPRFGVMRSREFIMKDTYSFDLTEYDAIQNYYKVFTSYLKTFKRLGLNILPVKADAGPIGGSLNHEFVVLSEKGESEIIYDERILNLDVKLDDSYENIFKTFTSFVSTIYKNNSKILDKNLKHTNGIELGHIFYFGTKYSSPMNVAITNQNDQKIDLFMGSYGIGISRTVATIIEINNDQNGIIWPISVAPYQVAIINLNIKNEKINNLCEDLYNKFINAKIDVIYHDTNAHIGSKLSFIDLIGIPYQIIVGNKEIEDNIIIFKVRVSGEKIPMSIEQCINFILSKINCSF